MSFNSLKTPENLVKAMQEKSIRALAKSITKVEDGGEQAETLLSLMASSLASSQNKNQASHIIGITGPPGAGKSSLLSSFTEYLRHLGLTVGIAAVDPSSPFTGGAILGDRIRMQNHCSDPGVYIRSMGTRGNLGGLSSSTHAVIKALDFYHFDVIIIETVGIGQSEVAIMEVADTVVVVEAPGMGDEIQAIKAGVMEIGHVFVVNKADRPGVDKTVLQIKANLDMAGIAKKYRPPVLKCIATENKGMEALYKSIKAHWDYLISDDSGLMANRARKNLKILDTLLRDRISREFQARKQQDGPVKNMIEKMDAQGIDPYTASGEIYKELM